jgi:nitrate/TMAO reductase-like tetraheme cytochrome c subunit
MEIGARYHNIHTVELELSCFSCHVSTEYDDATEYQRKDKVPATSVTDRATCIGCHRASGIASELYGYEGN